MSSLAFLTHLAFLVLLLTDGSGLKIVNLVVPLSVPNNTDSTVLLDCDYSLELSSDNGLVVKWFLNDYPNPVYQWIPGNRPQGLGVLKGRIDLDFKASQDSRKMYRAIKIRDPSGELSGDYTCSVSTWDDEARETKRMTVYTPASRFEFLKEENGETGETSLKCSVSGVYPEPWLNVTTPETTKAVMFRSEVVTYSEDGLYDSVANVTLNRKDLKEKTMFQCEVTIPHTDYVLRKSIAVHPDGSSSGSSVEAAVFSVFLLSFLSVRI